MGGSASKKRSTKSRGRREDSDSGEIRRGYRRDGTTPATTPARTATKSAMSEPPLKKKETTVKEKREWVVGSHVAYDQRHLTQMIPLPKENAYHPSEYSEDSSMELMSMEDKLLQKYSVAIHECHFGSEERTKAWASAAGYPRWASKMTGIATIDDFVSVTQISQIINFARKVLNIDEEDLDDFVEAVVEYQQAKGNDASLIWLVLEVWARELFEEDDVMPMVLLQMIVRFSITQIIPLLGGAAYLEVSVPNFQFIHTSESKDEFSVMKVDESFFRSVVYMMDRQFSAQPDRDNIANMITDTPDCMNTTKALRFPGYHRHFRSREKTAYLIPLLSDTTVINTPNETTKTLTKTLKFVFTFSISPGEVWTGIEELKIRTANAKVISLYVAHRKTSESCVLSRAKADCHIPRTERKQWTPVGKRVVVLAKPAASETLARKTLQRVKINWFAPMPFDVIKMVFEDSWADRNPEGMAPVYQEISVDSIQFLGYSRPSYD